MKQLRFARIILLITWGFLTSCQDQIGQTENPTTTQQENNTASNNNTSSNQSSPNNKADNNKLNADPSDPEGRLLEGEWSNEERFTIIPPIYDDAGDTRVSFCDISRSSHSVLIIEISSNIQTYYTCPLDTPASESPVSEYRHGYTKMKVKRKLHLGGIRLPLEFELNNLLSEASHPEGKNYLIGVAEIDGKFFSTNSMKEITLYDPEIDSSRIEFSGKKEALISNAEAHMQNRENLCQGNNATSEEAFKENILEREDGQCDYLNQQ